MVNGCVSCVHSLRSPGAERKRARLEAGEDQDHFHDPAVLDCMCLQAAKADYLSTCRELFGSASRRKLGSYDPNVQEFRERGSFRQIHLGASYLALSILDRFYMWVLGR